MSRNFRGGGTLRIGMSFALLFPITLLFTPTSMKRTHPVQVRRRPDQDEADPEREARPSSVCSLYREHRMGRDGCGLGPPLCANLSSTGVAVKPSRLDADSESMATSGPRIFPLL